VECSTAQQPHASVKALKLRGGTGVEIEQRLMRRDAEATAGASVGAGAEMDPRAEFSLIPDAIAEPGTLGGGNALDANPAGGLLWKAYLSAESKRCAKRRRATKDRRGCR